MKTMKKGFMFSVSMVLILSVMAGCSTNNDKPNASPTGEAASNLPATTTPPSTEKVKITYSMWGSEAEGSKTQEAADKFNASQNKIEVKVQAIPWENYMTKLNTQATAGQLPDTGILKEDGIIQW
ncbi:extracellular solute-binding protein, partial [Paenibacillus sp. TAF58]